MSSRQTLDIRSGDEDALSNTSSLEARPRGDGSAPRAGSQHHGSGRLPQHGAASRASPAQLSLAVPPLAHEAPSSGVGSHIFADGTHYEGEWRNGVPHGEGMCVFAGTRNVYIGSWSGGRCEGRGALIYADTGDFYLGGWARGACEGSGLFVAAGVATEGVWARGVLQPGAHVAPLASQSPGVSGGLPHFQALLPHGRVGGPAGAAAEALVLAKLHAFHAVVGALLGGRLSPSGPQQPAQHQQQSLVCARQVSATVGGGPRDLTTPPPGLREPFASGLDGSSPAFDGAAHGPRLGQLSPQQRSFAFSEGAPPALSLDGDAGGSTTQQRGVAKAGGGGVGGTTQRRGRANTQIWTSSRPAGAASDELGAGTGGGGHTGATGQRSGGAPPLAPNVPVGPRGAAAADGHDVVADAAVGTLRGSDSQLRQVLFAAAGPAYNNTFDLPRYARFFAIFMFPFLSLPHLRCCPLRISFLEIEREYVVSGAALRIDFEPPRAALYLAAVAVLSTWITVAFAESSSLGGADGVAVTDVVAPVLFVTLFAAMNAGYHSFRRVAHALERFDRHLYPKLAAFVATTVDSSSDICIYTWDEDGNSRVMNEHYRIRWISFAFAAAVLCAFCVPVLRAGEGRPTFGASSNENTAMAFAAVSTFLSSLGVTYYVLKISDMQRQVLSQMATLSKLAFMNGFSIMRPTFHPIGRFELDAPVDPHNIFEGYVGWYVTRCFVLYSSLCGNHAARAASMSAFTVVVGAVYLVAIADVLVAFAQERLTAESSPFTPAHALGLWIVLIWGSLLTRYIYVLSVTDAQQQHHVYLSDVAALYHQSVRHNDHAAGIVNLCRGMMSMHDHRPEVLGVRVRRGLLIVAATLQLGALVAIIFQLVQHAR